MKRRFCITFLSAILFTCAVTAFGDSYSGDSERAGAVFAMTNRSGHNQIVAFSRGSDGKLSQTGVYWTRGSGIGVDFDTQGGLALSGDHGYLYACNPGSDDVTVFRVRGSRLEFLQKVYAGDQPLSLTISGNLLYVLDGSVASTGITGFRIGSDGTLHPYQIQPSL